MIDAGNEIAIEEYEGMEHGFGRHENRYFQQTNERMEKCLKGKDFV